MSIPNNEGASREAIQYHYDIGNDFYKSWLDPTMTYTSAIWPDTGNISLQEAQEAKLDWHMKGYGPKDGNRVRDIGRG
jgi:cyclopropane-fatty-acyl-phospholipid synthase